MSDTGIIKLSDYDASLDNYLANICLGSDMGTVVRSRDIAQNVKQYTVACLIFNAVFEMDIDLIRTIATRIDGTVPEDSKRDGFANYFGDAIEDVLSYDQAGQLQITPQDPPVIAMAKALVFVGTQPCGNNYAKRKERNLAAQMILERTGGRKVQPARVQIETKYVEPEWLQLGTGEDDDTDGRANQTSTETGLGD